MGVRTSYVVSLPDSRQRRELFFAQPGVDDFQVFGALDLRAQTAAYVESLVNVPGFRLRYGREPMSGEMGCALSHVEVLRSIARDPALGPTDRALVCEDDAQFVDGWARRLDWLSSANVDILILGFNSPPTDILPDYRLEYVLDRIFPLSPLSARSDDRMFRAGILWPNSSAGTLAYVVSKRAAGIITRVADRGVDWVMDDYVMWRSHGLRVGMVRPDLVREFADVPSTIGTGADQVRGAHDPERRDRLVRLMTRRRSQLKMRVRLVADDVLTRSPFAWRTRGVHEHQGVRAT